MAWSLLKLDVRERSWGGGLVEEFDGVHGESEARDLNGTTREREMIYTMKGMFNTRRKNECR